MRPLVRDITYPFTCFPRRAYRFFNTLAEANVRHDSRRGNRIVFTAALMVLHPVQAIETARLTNSRNAMRQPQLGNVFGGNTLGVAAEVCVQVYETGQQVVPLQFQHPVPGAYFRPVIVFDGQAGITHIVDGNDTISFNDDVHRTDRRRPFTIDHDHPAKDQAVKRAFSPDPVGGHFRSGKSRQAKVNKNKGCQYADYFLHSFLALDRSWCYSIGRKRISWRKIVMDDATKSAAAAAFKVRQEPEKTREESGDAFVAYMDDSAEGTESQGKQQQENLTTSARALDRWFRERQKNQGAPRLLEVPNEVLVSNGGPLQITGNITLVHEDGRVQYANHLSLCRCGHSRSKPVCDDQHVDMEFLNSGKIFEVSEITASSRPSKITISCIKDGPITFRGRIRLHNQFGQECVKMRGSLCRCGQSASKPFCDGSHSRVGFKTG